MKRLFDVLLALASGALLLPLIVVIAALVRLTLRGSALYWSDRIRMPKFRTMKVGTPAVATHLLSNPDAHLTPIGGLLRRTSLDEVPQLWSILRGEMSFVGPRPALFNQDELIALRSAHGVDALVPGLTGWAQINGRDELPIPEKVRYDVEYLRRRSLIFDLQILWRTVFRVTGGDGVAH